jgi:hypothetical protein
MNRTRLAAGVAIPVLLAVVLAVLLLQGHRPAGEAAPAPTVAPTTTAPPPITTQPEPPKATGENWLAIMRDILTYRHSLYENPQPNLLDQIYDRRCPCYAQERKALADLERRGWRYNDKGVTVLKTTLLGRAAGNTSIVAVEVVSKSFPQILVDRTGKILERKSGSPATKTPYELLRGKDGRWRVSLIGISQPEG